MNPEFSRPLRIDAIGDGDNAMTIDANEAERAALAGRFGLIAIERLAATFIVKREAQGIVARGHVDAMLTQACSVTGDPLPATVSEDVAIRFLEDDAPEGEEVELGDGDLDTMFYEGSAIDLGEAAAETMALALDPYPRGPGAAAALRAAGVVSEEDARPLTALAGLKSLLQGD